MYLIAISLYLMLLSLMLIVWNSNALNAISLLFICRIFITRLLHSLQHLVSSITVISISHFLGISTRTRCLSTMHCSMGCFLSYSCAELLELFDFRRKHDYLLDSPTIHPTIAKHCHLFTTLHQIIPISIISIFPFILFLTLSILSIHSYYHYPQMTISDLLLLLALYLSALDLLISYYDHRNYLLQIPHHFLNLTFHFLLILLYRTILHPLHSFSINQELSTSHHDF